MAWRRRAPESRNKWKISILCGKGNNGGDGLVVARHLKATGIEAKVYFLGDPGEIDGRCEREFSAVEKCWRHGECCGQRE